MKARLAGAARSLRNRFTRLQGDSAIVARIFDEAFYLKRYPDVAEGGMDALAHFMTYGWKEGRDPNAEFSVRAYLDGFPEVEAAGINPVVHHLTSGKAAVRPESPLGFRFEVIEHLKPVDARIALSLAAPFHLRSRAELAAALARSRGGLAGLHITFSHDDYIGHVGGLQLCIGREASRLAERRRDHLHLHPAVPWPVLRNPDEPGGLGVVWNGVVLGAFAAEDVIAVLGEAAQASAAAGRSFAIHSLLGHTVEDTVAIVGAAGLRRGWFWLHDFASLGAGFHLLRNDVEDCAAPPPDSAACGVCVYGPMRARHTEGHWRLFEALELTVAAPAQVTLDLWLRASTAPAAATAVLPHAVLTPRGAAALPNAARPLRIAYAGMPAAFKGWMVFRNLVSRFAEDPRYEFIHLGGRPDPAVPVRFISVVGDSAQPLAMKTALQTADVDAVLVWPLCRETFSFVAYEAVAAGAAVLTGPDSGNVAAFVAETGHGQVLADEAALHEAFASGEILGQARAQRRPRLYDITYSALTLDLEGTGSS